MLLLKNKNPLFCLSIVILSIEIVSSLVDLKCNRLSNGCELKSYYCVDNINGSTCHFYVCDKIDANFNFTSTEMSQIRNCSSSHPEVQEALNNVYYRLSKPSVFSGSFDLLNNDLFLTSLKITSDLESDVNNGYEGMVGIKNKLLFRYIKGFDTDDFKQKKIPIRIDFYYSKLDFYLNGSLIRYFIYLFKNTYLKIDPIEYYQSDAIFGTVPLCSYEAVCHAIEKLAGRLFVSSLSILLFFYKAFDRKFDAMLKKTLFSSKK